MLDKYTIHGSYWALHQVLHVKAGELDTFSSFSTETPLKNMFLHSAYPLFLAESIWDPRTWLFVHVDGCFFHVFFLCVMFLFKSNRKQKKHLTQPPCMRVRFQSPNSQSFQRFLVFFDPMFGSMQNLRGDFLRIQRLVAAVSVSANAEMKASTGGGFIYVDPLSINPVFPW